MYMQQGDVLAKPVPSIPKGLKKLTGNLIHQGRDHHHRIEGKFDLFEGAEGFFIRAKAECKLTHPEHKTITLPKGTYQKGIVMEFDHFLEESRQVID